MILRDGCEFRYYESKHNTKPLWFLNNKRLYCKKEDISTIGAGAFIWLTQTQKIQNDFCHILDILDIAVIEEWVETLDDVSNLVKEIKRYIPTFKLGNDPYEISTSIQWAWIDLQGILYFIDYSTKNINCIANEPLVDNIQNASTIKQLARLFLSDFNVKV